MDNNDQPNELDNQPKDPQDPSERLPEATRGHIQDILQGNSSIEALRRTNHKEALKGNTHNLKTGKYSKLLPQYLINHLTFIDELAFVGTGDLRDTVIRLLKTNLKRIAIAEFREAEWQNIDPHLSRLVRDSFVMAQAIYHTPTLMTKGNEDELDYLKDLDKDQLETIDIIMTALFEATTPRKTPVLAS